MRIKKIELVNYRNHGHLLLDEIGKMLIIVGDNAVGKTNIIEALQFLCMHESFRKPKNEEIIYRKKIQGEETKATITVDILSVDNIKQVSFVDNSKVFSYNKKERPAKEIIDIIPAVLFTPDDLHIIKGPPEQRRDMVDSLGTRLSKTFMQIKSEYNKALRHKNSLLRQEEVEIALLDSWNINLAKLGSSLTKHRLGLLKQLLKEASFFYKKISGGEELEGEYVSLWLQTAEPTEEELYKALEENREADISAKRSLLGPHKDDVYFTIDGDDTRRFASQGQQRSVALSLKMAEIEILKRVSGKTPLLLLDDVMSELDARRRKDFVNLIREASQTVITTTNLGYFDEDFLKGATVVELKRNKEV